ncbi:hypothetical protein ZIOFF_056029 [Zingiber officinale]|uniref:Uncharacterized protein n=1 Tax=Zingiber officinale TaxID=94328 RepID=A0A8J5KKS6_ZINOF|nr:hypothetical protein ZIOFF_056029 [Zingiber officinale]
MRRWARRGGGFQRSKDPSLQALRRRLLIFLENEIERRLIELYDGSHEAGEAEVQGAERDDEASKAGEGARGEATDGQHHAPNAEARPGTVAGEGVEVAHGGEQMPLASPPRGKKPCSPRGSSGRPWRMRRQLAGERAAGGEDA